MSNKNGSDKGNAADLIARADALLERAYYASAETDLALGIARARAELAKLARG